MTVSPTVEERLRVLFHDIFQSSGMLPRCGGTHAMGYGYCQVLATRLAKEHGLVVTASEETVIGEGELDELRALSDAATPGPWVPQSPTDGRRLDWYLDTHYNEDGPEPIWADDYPVSDANIAFIAAAVNYVRERLRR